MGFVDIHCHLLWNLDDGCQSASEALDAARALAALGYSEAAPSPHVRAAFPGVGPGICQARLEELRALLEEEGVPLRLHPGAENFLDETFLERALRGEAQGLGAAGRHVLVELPFENRVPALSDVLFRLRRKGLFPVLAHPERCAEFEEGRAEEAVRLGAGLQLDLGALVGRYGRQVRKAAERLLEDELYAFAATDLHCPDDVREWVGEALDVLQKRVGPAGLRRLCEENPGRALRGEELT